MPTVKASPVSISQAPLGWLLDQRRFQGSIPLKND
jgi:hypothetical protein